MLRNFLDYKIVSVSHLEAIVQKRRSYEQTPKYTAEYVHDRANHQARNSVAGSLPVLQVRWQEMYCKRPGCSDTYNY